ncbi:uncharacterized protein C8Q71DRAFT_856675 [Rhodofomes roseus]|uniref:Uncharacterized protein n=1 Tax=Rhodofomes roseus TaxID=34475 RepID=A0ABQ8KKR7_9APHY|nr:uncharacterized protein C8Q71DRAFT_856675 [Rhodofomes roseus]KAH9838748.1 hypothetical protein C8Q71DRAFT_856675 [Rhodofomes roseus]
MSDAYETSNYPPPGDSTSTGGYGSANTFSDPVQRGRQDLVNNESETGLVDQSLSGGPIGQEIDDAKQGRDEASRKDFTHEAERDFDRGNGSAGLNPYGQNPDSRGEATEMLASRYADSRGKHFESGAAGGNDADIGA